MIKKSFGWLILLGISFGLSLGLSAIAADITTSVVVTITPAPPSSLSASTVSTTAIDLSWSDTSSNEDGFRVERKTGSGGTYAQIATTSPNVATYSDAGLTANTSYFYRVLAFNSDGDSAYSNEASSTTSASSGSGGSGGGGGGGGGGAGTPITAVVFEGKAYPGSDVTLLKDAQVVFPAQWDPKLGIHVT